jgi:FkbM family methyltransferase
MRIQGPLFDCWPIFEVFAFDEYDFAPVRWSQIRSVIDVGAHIGSFTKWVADRSPCVITALEPNPTIAVLLQENLTSLRDRVQIRHLALAGRPGERYLVDRGLPGGSSIVSAESNARTQFRVEAITLDELIAEISPDGVDLLKMDIEGAEMEVFESVSQITLRKIGNAIIECHPSRGAIPEAIASKLRQSGMEVAIEANRLVVGWRR